ncbi:MAG TPA: type II toxin-antitoxin system VapC family toxin [Solirubrobacterales bacterium]|jgi:predicted nucleic acid-binding protein|nr:type II toxin-antitoxin system VapC family toxin [Solirubrobacterales bacterium]
MPPERLLLDSSVWIASRTLGERFHSPALEIVLDTARPAAVLDLTLYEIANAVGARRGDLHMLARIFRSVEQRCFESVVRADPVLVEMVAGIAVEHGLTAYDAAYVGVARRYEWQLVSTDIRDLVSKGLAITPDAAV